MSRPQIVHGVDNGVNFAPKNALHFTQIAAQFTKADVSDDQEIHIAAGTFRAGGHRAEHESGDDPAFDSAEPVPDHIEQAAALSQKPSQLREQWVRPFGFVEHLPAAPARFEDSRSFESAEWSLKGGRRDPQSPRKLPAVERFVPRAHEELGQDQLAKDGHDGIQR